MDRLLLRALETAAVGIVITDRQGLIEWINPGFSRMTGYTWDEVVGRNPRLQKSGVHSSAFYDELWKTLLAGVPWQGEMTNRRKDGSLYPEEQVITPVRDTLGEITHFIAIKQDISARRAAEQALRESEQRYHALIEGLGEGVVSVDSKERILTANPAAEAILGTDRGTLVGRTILDFVDPADMDLLLSQSVRRQLGEKSVYEVRVIRVDGARRTLQITASPTCDENGRFLNSVGIMRDITSEKAMRQRINLLAHTIDSLDESVSICGPDDRLIFVNRSFLRTYGYAESDLIGKPISLVRSPLNPPALTTGILPATLEGGWRGELWNRRKDGSDFPIMLTTAAVTDEHGIVEATVGVARDITERRHANAELQRAKEEAESASHVKSEFLATMSHEIRTPLNGVIGMTGLLLDTNLTNEQREYAETVRKSGEALLTVINDILDFSKMEAGKLHIESFPFDLRLVVEEVNEMLAPRADEHNLGLVLEYSASYPRYFLGDGGRVRQVVTNLVGNAVKFTASGHVLITVDCLKQDADTAHMRVSVKDTGVGIPAERLTSLFEKFSQVDSSTTRQYGGTGLGLAIARQLTELMGGSIGVESRVGEGSTFYFSLPLQLDPHPQTAPVDAAALKGLRALIVDDQELNRRVLQEHVAGWGMLGVSAASASEALRELDRAHGARTPYHFVLLDYQMPVTDGASLAASIKSDPKLKETVVVMLTSIGYWAEVNRNQGGAIDACLAKPVRQSLFQGTLGMTWARRKAGVPAGTENRIESMKSTLAGRFAGSPIRILLAEDNVVNQKVAARMLERLGLRMDVAANGREAVEMCGLIPYDLVLMDCQMPEMDGYEATREIRRRQGAGRRMSIVAMTADAMAGTRERCLEAGMDEHIAKPVKLEDLFDALQKWS